MQFPMVTRKLLAVSPSGRIPKRRKVAAAGTTAAVAVLIAAAGVEAATGSGSSAAASGGHAPGFSVSAAQPARQISGHSGLTGHTTAPDAAKHRADFTAATHPHAAKSAPKPATAAAPAVKATAEHHAAAHPAAHAPAAPAAPSAAPVHHAKAPAAAKHKAVHHKATHHKATHHKAAAHKAAKHHAHKAYANNLDGWIRQSLAILHAKHIPASYDGIHRNIMRESSGNPRAINLWDVNAQNGIPSKGLLQVIDPTFRTYHVSGTSWNIYNPVSNITAACNYAADRYGSMDNVNSAY